MSNIVPMKSVQKKTTGQYRMLNKGGDSGEIWIYGAIGQDWFSEGVTAKQFATDLKALGKVQNIDLRINSDGGSVTDARAMYNLLVEHPANVTVHIDGIAASAASFLAMAGKDIIISEGGFVMIHNARSMVFGEAKDLRSMATVLDQVNQTIIDTYVARTGSDAKKIQKWMDDETWFTGKESVAAGFADKVTANQMKVAASLTHPERFRNLPAVLRPNRDRALAAIAAMQPVARAAFPNRAKALRLMGAKTRTRNENPNHDENGRFSEGSGGGGGDSNQVTSDEMFEFVQSATDHLDGSISDDLTEHANNMTDAASSLRDALDNMSEASKTLDSAPEGEEGQAQEDAATAVQETYAAMKEFAAAAATSLASATQAANDAKAAMKEFETHAKAAGISLA